MFYGYMRVSTKDQNEERQRIALIAEGVEQKNIILDKQSGKDFDRPGYRKLCKKIKPGDTLFIKSIDRLGRNYNDILEQWRYLTKEKNIAIVVLDMPLLDTRKGRDLTGELIADIVLQLLSYVAQTEREFIRQRQAEGIAAAKARGVHFGRQTIPIPPEFEQVYRHWKSQNLSARKAGALLGVTHQTFLKWAKHQGNSLRLIKQDLHTRVSQGMRESKQSGEQIGLEKGATWTTEKSIRCKAIIKSMPLTLVAHLVTTK